MQNDGKFPLVAIIMGSDSDLEVMKKAVDVLEEFNVAHEIKILSAHRTPAQTADYVESADHRGVQVFIAGAGMAAHLAGAVAAHTNKPVIGIPLDSGSLKGVDALYSTIQMPPGMPVATVGIDAAKNAALLAIQILALADADLQTKLKHYKQKMAEDVIAKSNRLNQIGIKTYLERKNKPTPTSIEESIVPRATIIKAIPQVLKTVDLPDLGKKLQGKVRDIYVQGERRILISTDRQSAFDVVLGHIPYRGAMLNQLAAWWFGETAHIIPNHLLTVPDPNVSIVRNCQIIPVEMVVRGYLSGSTKTSVWTAYEKGERVIYGLTFPEGMRKNQKLVQPIITPTTHAESGSGLHDEKLTREKILKEQIVNRALYEQMEKVSLDLFEYGSEWCRRQGLVLVDTKYEFGLYKGKLMLIDEIHTPDSSRFWKADSYPERFSQGKEPENFDKEILRLWYVERGYSGEGTPPLMSEDLIVMMAQRYVKVYEMITGKKFDLFDYPIEERIKSNIEGKI